ncbi:MAG: transglutaminase-like domain-containing protein [Thermoplasmatota archaeon]|jgi:hypothetical protein
MEKYHKIIGWQIHHQEKLLYQTNAGTPTIRLKFFHYPTYRQTVKIDKYPEQCKLKVKGNNSFFIFQHKISSKGIISLDRIITVFPNTSFINLNENLGKISDFSQEIQQKYKQGSNYWPTQSNLIKNISKEKWYTNDDLSNWLQSAFNYVNLKIKHREKQEKRLGANYAFLKGIGDCDEFTDLFITIARMRGIPCRRLTGYFIVQKKNFFTEPHAWGEILSPCMRWIPIDIALNNFGNHRINYIILKIEEFNPALSDYEIKTKQTNLVHYNWEQPDAIITPIY